MVALTVFLVIAATGCSVTQTPTERPTQASAAAPSPTGTATGGPSDQTPLPTSVPCVITSTQSCDPIADEMIVVDLGPLPFANGEVVLNEAGEPAYYVVADGDVWGSILDRLFPNDGGFSKMNCHRIAGFDFWAGDIINLDPATITTVGTYHGGSEGMNQLTRDSCLQQSGIPPQH
jgi:hypothetical protein